jgi:hypothetical protein
VNYAVPAANFQTGCALATMFVSGIPDPSSVLLIGSTLRRSIHSKSTVLGSLREMSEFPQCLRGNWLKEGEYGFSYRRNKALNLFALGRAPSKTGRLMPCECQRAASSTGADWNALWMLLDTLNGHFPFRVSVSPTPDNL